MVKGRKIWLPALIGIVLLIVIFYPKKEPVEEVLDEVEVTDSTEVEEIVYQYGIPIGDYDVDYGLVKNNQSLSTILQKHGLSVTQVHQLAQASHSVFDVRKIRSGQAYAVFATKDSLHIPSFFVYEEDPRSYVVFDLRGDYKVTRGYHPVEWVSKKVMGEVESSLWVAMQKYEADPQLAVVLSQIFGWTIDFFGRKRMNFGCCINRKRSMENVCSTSMYRQPPSVMETAPTMRFLSNRMERYYITMTRGIVWKGHF